MRFSHVYNCDDESSRAIAAELLQACISRGYKECSSDERPSLVINVTSVTSARPVRRSSEATFVCSVISVETEECDLKRLCYTTLVRTLSNLLLCVVPSGRSDLRNCSIYFTTPELGFYLVPYDSFCEKVLAMASVQFIIQNDVHYDLPAAYHESSPVVEEIKKYGRELAGMGLLPTPFPLKEVLSARELRHVYKIFGLTGLSYGNLSAREDVFGNGSASFWVTARGVDKSRLELVGRDMVLVKGLNQPAGAVMTSLPPFADPTVRASTDAFEHLLIYERFAEIHAIVHVHAWMEKVLCTRQNYPCGTWELAREVVDLLATAPDPTRAVIGLKNHGLTVTGRDFADIFDRLRGKLQLNVEMLA